MDTLVSAFIVINEILNAGNSITAFALLLYALTFNLRERVARSLALVLGCVTIAYFGDVLAGTAATSGELTIWLRLQWIGIAFFPATYLHFSDALLAATGRPSRGRRRLAVGISYVLGAATLLAVGLTSAVAGEQVSFETIAYLRPGPWFPLFFAFTAFDFVFAWWNFWRSYQRCLTRSSRRRMRYLLLGAVGPALGTFPFMMVLGGLMAQHALLSWGFAALINMAVAVQLVLISYSVAYFGVTYPDRVVKSRLAQWILRGPVVASTVLAVTVVLNRLVSMLGLEYSRAVPFAMVATLLLVQFVITLVRPTIERWFFYGEDRYDLVRLQLLEERLLTTGDLRQYLELILNAACDLISVSSAFIAVVGPGGLELEVAVGPEDPFRGSEDLPPLLVEDEGKKVFDGLGAVIAWDVYWLIPLTLDRTGEMIGLLGVRSRASEPDFTPEEINSLRLLLQRASVALADRLLQRGVFNLIDHLVPQVDAIQRVRAAAYSGSPMSLSESMNGVHTREELAQFVREALGHYWGGPGLTSSPLLSLRIVRQTTDQHDGNPVNALRAILRGSIERVRPEGERRFTAEWMLYNILEMKFLQGKKVRDIAMRLAMSEADLYRKQRVAIEEVARGIAEMELEAVKAKGDEEVLGKEV